MDVIFINPESKVPFIVWKDEECFFAYSKRLFLSPYDSLKPKYNVLCYKELVSW